MAALQSVALLAAVALRGRAPPPQRSGWFSAALQLLLCGFWLRLAFALDPSSPRGPTASLRPVHWRAVLAPLWCARLLLSAALLRVAARHRRGLYRLAPAQLSALALYVASCALMCVGEAARASGWRFRCWTDLALACGAACFCLALRLAFATHATQLAASRGHLQPLALEQTAQGHWAPTGDRTSFWCEHASSLVSSLLSFSLFGYVRACVGFFFFFSSRNSRARG